MEKDAVDKGLQSIKEGRFKSHEEVTEATKKNTLDCSSNLNYANHMVG